jgi:peptidyl-prolyl cis-trans isomerase C
MSRFYEANRRSFMEPETFRASHILVQDQEIAKRALERVKGGEPFAKVAEELSMDPTKTRGGDIGPFTKGQLLPEFEAACEELKPGALSGVVKSPVGYHVILLTERKVPRQRSLEEVRDLIRQQLSSQGQRRNVEQYVQQLRAKAQIKIYEPFSKKPPASSPPATAPVSQPPKS